MDFEHIVSELSRNGYVFRELLSDLKGDILRWKQAPEKWCMLEIACHLYDEEREDFRARTAHILSDPSLDMPSIDPVAWVTERSYMQQDYDAILGKFLAERAESIHWLQALKSPDWNKAYMHPKVGPVSAELILTNWVAHDYLHIRQIIRLKYDYLVAHSSVPMDYAGNW